MERVGPRWMQGMEQGKAGDGGWVLGSGEVRRRRRAGVDAAAAEGERSKA